MKIMEMNEEISCAKELDYLQEKLIYVNNEIDKRFYELEKLFFDKNLKKARRCINELHYLKRTKKIISSKLPNNLESYIKNF